jgi:hypothetical protein
VSEQLTDKQVKNRRYYRQHKDKIKARKKVYHDEHREERNAAARRRRRKPGKKCFLCGGEIVTDGSVWSCMNPECEADFVEVDA